jgi:hypothetical protein
MPVTSDFILYVGTSAYDLRKVSSSVPAQDDPLYRMVRFIDEPRAAIRFLAATFDPAWQAALDASEGGGGGSEKVEYVPASGAGPVAVNYGLASVWDITLTSGPAAIPITLSGAIAPKSCSVMIILRQDGAGSRTVSWPVSVLWPNATPPVLTTSPGGIDIVSMFTVDGGVSWFGNPGLPNLS